MKILFYDSSDTIKSNDFKKEKFDLYFCYKKDELLKKASKNNYDLLVIKISDINKFEKILLSIREKNKNIFIIALYKTINDKIKIDLIDKGLDDYISIANKKAIISKIYSIYRLISRYKNITDNKIKFDNLTLNISNMTVCSDKYTVNLTKKEFDLLKYLILNKNKVITRMMIAEKLWDLDYGINTNIVDVFISHLRSKIEKKFNKKIIRSVRGVGYIIMENEGRTL